MNDRSLFEICLAVGVTVTLILMISGNWHPPENLQIVFWVGLALIAVALLIFTKIGRGIISLAFLGIFIWGIFTGQLHKWFDQIPEWITDCFLIILLGYFIWLAFDASRKRITKTRKLNPELSGFALMRQSWRDRKQILRSDEWIKSNQEKD
ncbi:MAG: hypothetical protein ACPGVT_08075 [Maricaulaceae bacterium]